MKNALLIIAVLLTMPYAGNTQSIKTLNKPLMDGLDEVTPFHDGLAAVRKGSQWGFIDMDGRLVIEQRNRLGLRGAAERSPAMERDRLERRQRIRV